MRAPLVDRRCLVDEMTTGVVAAPGASRAGRTTPAIRRQLLHTQRPAAVPVRHGHVCPDVPVGRRESRHVARGTDAARDMGVNLYENLQYQRPGHRDARRRLAQVPGHGSAVPVARTRVHARHADRPQHGDRARAAARNRASCVRTTRGSCGDVPGLLYYINGDYQLDLTAASPRPCSESGGSGCGRATRRSRRWQQAWGRAGLPGDFDQIEYPPAELGALGRRAADRRRAVSHGTDHTLECVRTWRPFARLIRTIRSRRSTTREPRKASTCR